MADRALLETSADPARRGRPRNGAATAALVLGLLAVPLSVLAGVPAVLAGLVGLVRSRSRGTGGGRAATGLLLGLASVAVLVLAVSQLAPLWSTAQAVRAARSGQLPAADRAHVEAGLTEAAHVLEQVGVDPSSVDCATPSPQGASVVVDCTGTGASGRAAGLSASCPATALVAGGGTCALTVDGVRHEVAVELRDGVPVAQLL
ncbi:hypothetical protein [Quadrisphaera sp. DSM 44207]|uniref:hypothetical protein n=1 Tax=Quadrisphaera sp. DSM 44207 TaxID=1881057 RepID=UPI00088081D3|nr:hypothetical protein [Quadrisphaera sp. DSM 44207]SDQ75714.1 hypothetical protein SAMN05428996_2689 [Quadrisphaera sp. DSM 44207]